MNVPRTRSVLLVAAVLALTAAACGDVDDHDVAQSGTTAPLRASHR